MTGSPDNKIGRRDFIKLAGLVAGGLASEVLFPPNIAQAKAVETFVGQGEPGYFGQFPVDNAEIGSVMGTSVGSLTEQVGLQSTSGVLRVVRNTLLEGGMNP